MAASVKFPLQKTNGQFEVGMTQAGGVNVGLVNDWMRIV